MSEVNIDLAWVVDDCARALAALCRPFSGDCVDPDARATLEEVRPVVERWILCQGWDAETVEARAAVLLRLAVYLCGLQGDPIPTEWLLFPVNATYALFTLAETREAPAERDRDKCCAEALLCYAMSLQHRCPNPAHILDSCSWCTWVYYPAFDPLPFPIASRRIKKVFDKTGSKPDGEP